MTGFNLMVQNCRQIIKRWPDSQYAYQAKRMLADLPPRYQTRYKVTKEEMDVSMFYKQRPGTQPFTMEESR
jgi:outer membrane protein assembly factor BamD (BamD/ComL family)